jgi:hypothetical protein
LQFVQIQKIKKNLIDILKKNYASAEPVLAPNLDQRKTMIVTSTATPNGVDLQLPKDQPPRDVFHPIALFECAYLVYFVVFDHRFCFGFASPNCPHYLMTVRSNLKILQVVLGLASCGNVCKG